MKYMVKTVYGTSAGHYTGSKSEPLAGTGQGSGVFPAMWLSIPNKSPHNLPATSGPIC